MKLSCQIVQDLLPLYEDGVCSDESRKAVEAHLTVCEGCANAADTNFKLPAFPSHSSQEENAVKNSLRKVRRRWIASVIAVAMILPLVLLGKLGYNEYHKEGVCFSNLDELWSCHGFLAALEDGDTEQAASYIDFSDYYEECREAIEMQPEDFMPSYVEVVIDGEAWMAYPSFIEEYALSQDDAWSDLINRCVPEAPIPIDIWKEVIGQDEEVHTLQNQGCRMPNGTCYLPYETKWGTFMVVDAAWDCLTEIGDGALFSDYFSMLPQTMYLEILPELERKAEEACNAIKERMKAVADLNEAEFERFMRKQYAEKLKELPYTIADTDYQESYRDNDEWYIDIDVDLQKDGELFRIRFAFYAKDGKISFLSVNASNEAQDSDMFYNIFTPRM